MANSKEKHWQINKNNFKGKHTSKIVKVIRIARFEFVMTEILYTKYIHIFFFLSQTQIFFLKVIYCDI